LAPTVGIAAIGFCYPGGILPIFSSTRSANFAAADSSSNNFIIGLPDGAAVLATAVVDYFADWIKKSWRDQ
jgi:hypothetical protein